MVKTFDFKPRLLSCLRNYNRKTFIADIMAGIIVGIVALPLAIAFGFRTEKLIAILVMLGSATTGSCFVMARNMGHQGTITACSVMLTTLCSAFTLTFWLFFLRTLQYI